MAKTTDKLSGTCSVCLRPMQLHGSSPIRHGFSAVGVRHGQHGGYHTGPCAGSNFPHLGISDEGTRWALDRARTSLDRVRGDLATLATNPDIIWYPTQYNVRGRPLDLSRPLTLKYGVEAPYGSGASYAYEHRQRKAKLDAHESELERSIAAYEKVIATWSPQKYPTTGAAAKVETVHMERPIKKLGGETMMGILCRTVRRGGAAFLPKTNDPSKVTCKRCRAALGLPPL